MIYDYAITNMFFNAQKFHYVSFNTDPTGNKCNVYVNPKMDIIPHSSNVQDLRITMSSDCTFSGVVGRERMGTAFPHKKLSGNGVPTREILRDS